MVDLENVLDDHGLSTCAWPGALVFARKRACDMRYGIELIPFGLFSDPREVVKVAQRVKVRVLSVDLPRKRIALSMKNLG